MKHILILLIGLSFGQFGFGQEFKYEFKLVSITEAGLAKGTIMDIRDLLGVKVILFHDEIDEFEILTHLEWEIEELVYDFGSIGLVVDGLITKTNLE